MPFLNSSPFKVINFKFSLENILSSCVVGICTKVTICKGY